MLFYERYAVLIVHNHYRVTDKQNEINNVSVNQNDFLKHWFLSDIGKQSLVATPSSARDAGETGVLYEKNGSERISVNRRISWNFQY